MAASSTTQQVDYNQGQIRNVDRVSPFERLERRFGEENGLIGFARQELQA
jgi:hypothetical protein